MQSSGYPTRRETLDRPCRSIYLRREQHLILGVQAHRECAERPLDSADDTK